MVIVREMQDRLLGPPAPLEVAYNEPRNTAARNFGSSYPKGKLALLAGRLKTQASTEARLETKAT